MELLDLYIYSFSLFVSQPNRYYGLTVSVYREAPNHFLESPLSCARHNPQDLITPPLRDLLRRYRGVFGIAFAYPSFLSSINPTNQIRVDNVC